MTCPDVSNKTLRNYAFTIKSTITCHVFGEVAQHLPAFQVLLIKTSLIEEPKKNLKKKNQLMENFLDFRPIF